MPFDRSRYPKNWDEIALRVKSEAGWTCEACGRPCRRPGEDDQDLIDRISLERPDWTKDLYEQVDTEEFGLIDVPKLVRFTLTVAHVNHDPENPDAVLKAWCSVCHCRYDLKAVHQKRQMAAERRGQLRMEGV